MGVIFFWALIALLYFCAIVPALWTRDWPSVLISTGCVLVLIGNIWSHAKHV